MTIYTERRNIIGNVQAPKILREKIEAYPGIMPADRRLLASPLVISQKSISVLEIDLAKIGRMIKNIPKTHFKGDLGAFLDYLGCSRIYSRLQNAVPFTLENMPLRWDLVCTPQGDYKILELNTGYGIGGQMISAQLFDAYQVLSQASNDNIFPSLRCIDTPKLIAHSIQKHNPYLSSSDHLGIIDHEKSLAENIDFVSGICDYLNSYLPCDVSVLPVEEITLLDSYIVHNGLRISHLLASPFHELLDNANGDLILEALALGTLKLVFNPYDHIFQNKKLLALLSQSIEQDNGSYYSESERQLLSKYIPWTRIADCGNARYLSENLQNIVLKPANEFGGNGVVLGWADQSIDSHQVVASIIDSDCEYVAQERVRSRAFYSVSITHSMAVETGVGYPVIGLIMLEENIGGVYSRSFVNTIDDKIVNACKGASAGAVYIN